MCTSPFTSETQEAVHVLILIEMWKADRWVFIDPTSCIQQSRAIGSTSLWVCLVWSWEQKSVVIEVKYNLCFITDVKLIEVWHNRGFWGVTMQKVKSETKSGCFPSPLFIRSAGKETLPGRKDTTSTNGFFYQVCLNSGHLLGWNIFKMVAGYLFSLLLCLCLSVCFVVGFSFFF